MAPAPVTPRLSVSVVFVAATMAPAAPKLAEVTELSLQARDLLRRFPLIDGHNDLPWALRERAGGDVSKVRLARPRLAQATPPR